MDCSNNHAVISGETGQTYTATENGSYAVEITQNMGISGIDRIEEVTLTKLDSPEFDPMLQQVYKNLDQKAFHIPDSPEPIIFIDNIDIYNENEGLALSGDEVKYLEDVSKAINRKLTDSEIYGFAQINSEHCRHKIFNGTFIIEVIATLYVRSLRFMFLVK